MKYFSTKKKQVIKITSNNTKSSNTTILAIENDTDWRKLREGYDSRENLDKLLKPASSHERVLWKFADLNTANLEDLPDFPPNNNNFEDYLGIYKLLGSNLNRESTPNEIQEMYRAKRIAYRKNILSSHPDQNDGVDKWSQDITENGRAVDNAYKQFNQNL